MFYFILLLSLSWTLATINNNPKLYNGKCILMKDTVYYFGGKVFNRGKEEMNKHVYEMKLKQAEQLKWDKIDNNSLFNNKIYSNIIQYNKTMILMLREQDINTENEFIMYNIQSNTWIKDTQMKLSLNKVLNNNDSLINPYLVKDRDNDMIYLFGGKFKNNIYNKDIFIYNINKSTWDKRNFNEIIGINGEATYLKSMIIIIGGEKENQIKYKNNQLNLISLDIMNLITKSTSGIIPSSLSKFLITDYKDDVYIINNSNNNDNSIYKLKTSIFEWEKININELKVYEDACLIGYNEHLIVSFGKNKEEYNTDIQIINLKEGKLVDNIIDETHLTNNNNNNNNNIKSTQEINSNSIINTILGISISLLIIIIIFSTIFYIKYKKKINRNNKYNYKPPEYLDELLWIYNEKEVNSKINFDTQLTYIDSDLNSPEKALLSLNKKCSSYNYTKTL